MPVAKSTSNVDAMVEISGFSVPSNFHGTFSDIICRPYDWKFIKGQLDGEKPWSHAWSPFDLAVDVLITPDEGELDDDGEQIEPFRYAWPCGRLQYFITCTENCDPDSYTSDIDYPGDPSYPNGMNMEEFHEAAHELWSNAVDELDEEATSSEKLQKYNELLSENFGGKMPFAIGNEVRFQPGNAYSILVDNLPKNDDADILPHELLEGLYGRIVLTEKKLPKRKKPIETLIIKVDGDKSRNGSSESKPRSSSSSVVSNLEDKVTELAVDYIESQDKPVKLSEVRKHVRQSGEWSSGEKTEIFHMFNVDNVDFLNRLGEFDQDAGMIEA